MYAGFRAGACMELGAGGGSGLRAQSFRLGARGCMEHRDWGLRVGGSRLSHAAWGWGLHGLGTGGTGAQGQQGYMQWNHLPPPGTTPIPDM